MKFFHYYFFQLKETTLVFHLRLVKEQYLLAIENF